MRSARSQFAKFPDQQLTFVVIVFGVILLNFCTSTPKKTDKAKVSSITKEKVDFNTEWNDKFIDSHALSTPHSVENDLDSLANYLTYPFQTDRAKARSIFRWIASNIEYDWASYQSGSYIRIPMEAKDVLKSKSAVCEGYANLFKDLANRAGLESEKIIGYGKGFGYNPERALGDTNHAWNAVKIGGEWKLVDVTWARGGDPASNGEEKFNDFYFLTPPEHFINDHFPSVAKWQLLDRPISKTEFHKNVKKSPHFFNLGIEYVNQKKYMIRTDRMLLITLDTPKKLKFIGTLDKSNRHYFVSENPNGYEVFFIAPRRGTYSLKLYAKEDNYHEASNSERFRFLLEYKVFFDSGHIDNQFVTVYSGRHTIYEPVLKFLDAYQLYDFKLKAPGASQIAFIDGTGNWTYYKNPTSDYYFIRKSFPKGKLTINIDVGGNVWPTIAEYYVR